MSMKPEVKKEWVEALRSGNFKQAVGMLRRFQTVGPGPEAGKKETSYCCLGVLAEVNDMWVKVPNRLFGAQSALPSNSYPLCNAMGFTPEQQETLISMNDSQGKTFAEIADYIEENL